MAIGQGSGQDMGVGGGGGGARTKLWGLQGGAEATPVAMGQEGTKRWGRRIIA